MKKPRLPGSLKGQMHVPDDFAAPSKEIEELFYESQDEGQNNAADNANPPNGAQVPMD